MLRDIFDLGIVHYLQEVHGWTKIIHWGMRSETGVKIFSTFIYAKILWILLSFKRYNQNVVIKQTMHYYL